MNAKLFCKTGQLAGANYTISDEATIGKGPENTIQLYPSVVSTRHARISFDKKVNAFFIEDLRSRNGTRVDGMKVVGREKLNKLHVITIAGQFEFIFQFNSEVQGESPTQPKNAQPVVQPSPKQSPAKNVVADQKTVIDAGFEIAPKLGETPKSAPATPANKTVVGDDVLPLPVMVPAAPAKTPAVTPPPAPLPQDVRKKTVFGDDFLPMPGIPSAKPPAPAANVEEGRPAVAVELYIQFADLPGGPKSIKLKEGENTVGRESGCDIMIEDGSLSRKHAALTVRGGTVLLKDLGSKNHTFLENQKLNYEVEIRSGANLMFGMVKAILVKK